MSEKPQNGRSMQRRLAVNARHGPRLALTAAIALVGCTEGHSMASTEVQLFQACADQDFTITQPVAGRPWTPNAVTLVSEELAPGVFAVYDGNAAAQEPAGYSLATSGGFVIGQNGVLMVETMVNHQLLCQVYDLVRAETDLPVLYAVNTSFHGDHSFGNAFLPKDVMVVQHERAASHIASHFQEEKAFIEGALGTDQGIDEAGPRPPDLAVGDDGWTIDLGGITVEAQYHGFAQTDGDLFVYVPDARVLWTGNALVAAQPAIPWLLDGHAQEVRTTLAAVQAMLPEGAVVVPGHGRPAGEETFSFALAYLDALIAEVGASVHAGNDLEATQRMVIMEQYQGYALWDWIHTTVNLAKTYAELAR